jgi:hypothetical protein
MVTYLPIGQSREEEFSPAAHAAMGQQEEPLPETPEEIFKTMR